MVTKTIFWCLQLQSAILDNYHEAAKWMAVSDVALGDTISHQWQLTLPKVRQPSKLPVTAICMPELAIKGVWQLLKRWPNTCSGSTSSFHLTRLQRCLLGRTYLNSPLDISQPMTRPSCRCIHPGSSSCSWQALYLGPIGFVYPLQEISFLLHTCV